MSNKLTNEITELAGKYATEFGFSAKHGGSIDIVGGSPKAATAANQIMASLSHTGSIAKEAGLAMGVAAAASTMALGELNPLALGMAGMAGVISSISKGSHRGK